MKTTTTSSSPAKSQPPFAQPGKERVMNGADVVVEALAHEGVEVIFAYPGGASQELHQAFARSDKVRVILPRHEQGGSFAAEGYARASGKVGVCMATSGPGATNLVSAIADAFMDSTPLIAITGQVFSKFIGKSAFQETDFFGMTLPIVKHSYLVLNAHDLPRVFKEAFHLARTGRPGPVVIDIPKDVQQAKLTPVFPETVEFANPTLNALPHATDEELNEVLDLIAKAERPVIYAGGGVISAEAHGDLKKFAELTHIPVATTLMGVGAFPETHPLSMQWFGMHGSAYGNWAVDQADLVLCLGARFDDRITGDTSKFASHARIVHIDIDPSEHNKNKRVHHPIVSDLKHALSRLNELAAGAGGAKFTAPDTKSWHTQINAWKRDYPFAYDESRHIIPQEAVETLYQLTQGDAIIVTGVGQHQMWAAQFYRFNEPRRYISSLGLGAMGYGYPAALGAKIARPDKQVIDIDGDGSFLMNIQELATAAVEKIAAKVMILNNQHLGMVVQWEDRFYGSVRGNTILGHHDNIGGPDNPGGLYPDFVKIAEGFGVKGRRVIKKEELREAIQEMLAHDGPYLLDVVVPYTEHVLPMIPAGRTVKDMILK
ncbi:biosynthetic-type acetolactate synthase large subunit [Opitutaceae bacterium TAV4]|uniref:biosynthetic-type acetolactate synthase large subunit n=1 Tax=Geminisphaera colitermitum TaxID=1148786 RepID=UPI000158CA02|nr:biosynthetic-type acetolactate synthase large subunit [Geminisphaera colitermitum]RRJ95293.1 biosynthetic-type acetolactate synthase large subunit [Opitutaceae bacterium TAV4]RRJ99529.1 biosynthetic-type acetolactate synthase large subunit [Opitutaceae bacterium TAV3]